MTAKELDTMVNGMRTNYYSINSRRELTEPIHRLYAGLCALKRFEFAEEILTLWSEIELVDTGEIVKIGTFRQ